MASASPQQIGIQAVAVIMGTFLSGAMMGLSLVAVPAFLDSDSKAAHLLSNFTRLYHYGHRIMPALAIGTFSLYSITAFNRRAAGDLWSAPFVAGVVTLSLVPFTWIFMSPTNYALFRLYEQEKGGVSVAYSDARQLVFRWSLFHVVRSLFPLLGGVLGGIDVLRRLGYEF